MMPHVVGFKTTKRRNHVVASRNLPQVDQVLALYGTKTTQVAFGGQLKGKPHYKIGARRLLIHHKKVVVIDLRLNRHRTRIVSKMVDHQLRETGCQREPFDVVITRLPMFYDMLHLDPVATFFHFPLTMIHYTKRVFC